LERTFLLITADESFAGFMKEGLEPWGYLPDWRRNGKAQAGLKDPSTATRPVIIDLAAPNALESLSELKAYHPEAAVIAVANGDINVTAQSLKFSLSSLITDRASETALREALGRAFTDITRREELERLKSSTEQKIIAKSPAMKKAMKNATGIARTKEPVVLFGEPGSGRELLARHIHSTSAPPGAPFKKVIYEHELPAAVKAARGGTLFIKDIFALSKESLEALKTLIREGVFRSEGGEEFRANLRVMAGSVSSELSLDIPFKEIAVPPLRERTEDVIPLAECFLEELSLYLKKRKKFFTRKSKEILSGMEFREGNAAELKDLVHKAYFLSKGAGIGEKELLGSEYLGKNSFRTFIDQRLKGYIKKISELEHSNLYETVISEVERALLELALRETKGNKLRAARALGMNRNTFKAKIKQLGIKDKFSG
jgi:DNA-binding NtrC family response regulator